MSNGNETSTPSQPLINSQRRLYKATYRPVTIPPSARQEAGWFLEKLAFLRGLDIHPQEFTQLERGPSESAQPSPLTTKASLINAMRRLAADLSFSAMQQYGPLLASMSPE